MFSNRLIIILGASAVILSAWLWLFKSESPAAEQKQGQEQVQEQEQDQVQDQVQESVHIKKGDSLWVWNDTFMEFDFAGYYGEDDVKGIPSKDKDGDGLHDVSWKTLQAINYAKAYFEEFGMEVYLPAFPKNLQALDGMEITVEGFTIPFDGEEAFVALSASPFANCFFCGKGSPSSVISLYLEDEDATYKVDDFVKFKGRLRLNYDDPKEFYYILEDAKELDP